MTFGRELFSKGNPMEAVVGFSLAVRVGPFISIGGSAPVGPDGQTVGIGDVSSQTRQCTEVIDAALEHAGLGLHHVVRTRSSLQISTIGRLQLTFEKSSFVKSAPLVRLWLATAT